MIELEPIPQVEISLDSILMNLEARDTRAWCQVLIVPSLDEAAASIMQSQTVANSLASGAHPRRFFTGGSIPGS